MTTEPRESKCLFALCHAEQSPSGVPVLMFLMPDAAWHYMQSGLCHEFDLTNVGVPIQVVIGRCKDHAHGKAMMAQSGAMTKDTIDTTEADLDMHLDRKKTRQ